MARKKFTGTSAAGIESEAVSHRYMAAFTAASTGEDDIEFFPNEDTADEKKIIIAKHQFQVTLYNRAGGASQTVRLYGRLVEDEITGAWVQLGGNFVQAATAGFKHIALSAGIGGPNQFYLSRDGGGATSQVGVTFS